MSKLPEIHLCIVQPAGYVHSLGLVDQARYFRWQFRRLGANVSLAKNRLRHDAVNLVFGAHLGFDATQCRRHACVFVNLEQLGDGGAHRLRRLPAAAAPVGGGRLRRRQRGRLRDQDPTTCRWCRCCTRPTSPAPRPAAGGAPDRPAVHRQHERAPPRLAGPHRGLRPERRGVRLGAVRRRARPVHRAGQGRAELPLLREQPLRAGARGALPVAGHAGDLRAHRADAPARGLRGQRALARKATRARAVLRARTSAPPTSTRWRAPRCSASRPPTRSRPTPTCWPSPPASAARTMSAAPTEPWQPDAHQPRLRPRLPGPAG